MSFTTNQWAILALVLVFGWLLGLASRSGGTRWKRELAVERERRQAAEARIAAAEARVTELENRTVLAPAGIAAAPTTRSDTRRDDLALIRGISDSDQTRLNEQGYYRYAQIADLSDEDAAALDARLGYPTGTITGGEWREQAALLAARKGDEHATRYPRTV